MYIFSLLLVKNGYSSNFVFVNFTLIKFVGTPFLNIHFDESSKYEYIRLILEYHFQIAVVYLTLDTNIKYIGFDKSSTGF